MRTVVGIVAIMSLAGAALGAPQVKMNLNFSGDGNSGFKADLLANGSGVDFVTYCVENREFFSPGTKYFYTISDSVVDNNSGTGYGDPGNSPKSLVTYFDRDYDGDGFSDEVGETVAYLYNRFHNTGSATAALSGLLGGVSLTGGINDEEDAAELIQALCWGALYNYYGTRWTSAGDQGEIKDFFANVQTAAAAAAGTLAGELFNVRVMSLWFDSDGSGTLNDGDDDAQDMLIVIPLPSVSGLAFAGLLGLAAIRRRA